MPLDYKILEKYSNLHEQQALNSQLEQARTEVLNQWRKADKTKLPVVAQEFDDSAVINALNNCADMASIKDFEDFLGLGLASLKITAENENISMSSKNMSPEQVLQAVANYLNEPVSKLEIQTHYGIIVLPVVEVWAQDGVIKLSVATEQIEQPNV
jgi:hypothetical protein